MFKKILKNGIILNPNYKNLITSSIKGKFILNTRKSYSEVYNNIVKFSEDLNNNELKLPLYEKTYSYFYKNEDTISDFLKRIEGSDARIQKIEFLNHKGEVVTNLDQNLLNTAKNSFILKINGHIKVKYFPSVNLLISSENQNLNLAKENFSITNNFNFFLLKYFNCNNLSSIPTEKSITEFKNEVNTNLKNLLEIYEQLFNQVEKAKERLDKKYKSTMKLYLNLGILFFLLNVIVFYVLIYQVYGWDTVEPVTYIVGNIYWIIGLSFFVYKKKKLDFSFFHSEIFKNNFYKKNGILLGFNEVERNFLAKEIKEIKQFKEVLEKI